jgi:hypothetical protein
MGLNLKYMVVHAFESFAVGQVIKEFDGIQARMNSNHVVLVADVQPAKGTSMPDANLVAEDKPTAKENSK